MKNKQENIGHAIERLFAPIFHPETTQKNANLEERYMLQDDAMKEFEVDCSRMLSSPEEAHERNPGIDEARIWTVHEAEDHQYWVSETSSYVDRHGYYVAAKAVPRGIRIVTSSQCIYCDKEECLCERCSTCWQFDCDCHDDHETS